MPKKRLQKKTVRKTPKVPAAWFRDASGKLYSGFDNAGHFLFEHYDPTAPIAMKGKTFRLKSNPHVLQEDAFDIENIRIINPERIREAVAQLEKISEHEPEKELVCMITTGGTIATTYDENGVAQSATSAEYLLKFAGSGLGHRFGVVTVPFHRLTPSSQMEIDYVADTVIAMTWIYTQLSYHTRSRFAGFIIAHGTDTLNICATYAQIMLGPNLPFSVAYVGAQKSITHKITDVGINFAYSLNMLSEFKRNRKNTVFICSGGTQGGAFSPIGAIRISDTAVNIFDCPGRKKLMNASDFMLSGITSQFLNEFQRTSTTDDVFQPIIFRGYTNVATIRGQVGVNPEELFQYVSHLDKVALVLVAYGSFSFNYQQIDAIMKAAEEKDILVFAANQFPTGKFNHVFEETFYLTKKGVIPVQILEHAIYAKIRWAECVYGEDRKKIKFFVAGNNFVGEQPDDWTPPLEVIEEAEKNDGLKMRIIGQPTESMEKLP
ncbi:MAG: asparaginase domain-containing protein [Patescibacteria group bacterium]